MTSSRGYSNRLKLILDNWAKDTYMAFYIIENKQNLYRNKINNLNPSKKRNPNLVNI